LKKYLTSPPILVDPKPHKNLQLYISAIRNVVSVAIVIERGESETKRKVQYLSHPVLWPNRMLIVFVLRNEVYTRTI
jgi:hypothetical protein